MSEKNIHTERGSTVLSVYQRIFLRFIVAALIFQIIQLILLVWADARGGLWICPEWPSCFGRWIPPLSVNDLPRQVIPESFDFIQAWIEYVLRLVSVLFLFLVIYMTYYAVRFLHDDHAVFLGMIFLLLLILAEWITGIQYIGFHGSRWLVSFHILTGLAIFSLIIFLLYHSYRMLYPAISPEIPFSGRFRYLLMALWLLSLFQILMGYEVRRHFSRLRDIFSGDQITVISLTPTVVLHSVLGIGMVVMAVYICIRVIRYTREHVFMRYCLWSMTGTGGLLVLTGFLLFFTGFKTLMQVLHILFSAFFLSQILLVFLFLKNTITSQR